MKSKLFTLAAVLMIVGLALVACQPAAPAGDGGEEGTLKVVNLINGVLGDKSFFDSAERGVKKGSEEFGFEYKTIEAGIDPAKWQPALEDAAENEEYDVMILGTYQMSEFLQIVAPKYPDKKFILYDVSVDYTACDCSNVYSVLYKQNEGSYLAGYYAGLMTESNIIGAVGGQDIPVINDFIVGYEQGAKDANPDVEVVVQYAGGWNDPAKGKELALAMYQQGADIVFQVAGGTGVGIFQAAQEVGKWAIGVDSDQALIIEETNPEQAAVILTSMMKNVDNSLYRAMDLYYQDALPFGEAESLGVKEGGVGLAYNKFYDENTPDDVKEAMTAVEEELAAGNITVDTVFE
jgi:basic membrane protein A